MKAPRPNQQRKAKSGQYSYSTHQSSSSSNWKRGITGFLLGGALILVLFSISIAGKLNSRPASPTPTPHPIQRTSTPKIWATPTQEATPFVEIQPTPDMFQLAREMIDGGQSQGAVDILGPGVAQISKDTQKKSAYILLAQAELNLQNYNLAAAYLEKAQALQADPNLLWRAADAYDQGGSLECALVRYQSVVKNNDPALDPLRPTAESRVAALKQIFPTQIPCQ